MVMSAPRAPWIAFCPHGASPKTLIRGNRVRQPHAPAGKVMVKLKVSVPRAPRIALVQAAQ